MCNINVIIKKDMKNDRRVNELMNIMSWLSYVSNNDGEGYLDNNLNFGKCHDKVIYDKPRHWIVSHQRLATSGGKNKNNIHPHIMKNISLFHNGVFWSLGTNDKSDTRIYLEKIYGEYEKDKDILKAIRTVNFEIGGSYSVVLHDAETKRLLYYKNTCMTMFFLNTNEWLVMSTKEENVRYARKFLKLNCDITEVQPLKIFDLLNNMKEIGTFEEKTYKCYKQQRWAPEKWERDYHKNKKNGAIQNKIKEEKVSNKESEEYLREYKDIENYLEDTYQCQVLNMNDNDVFIACYDEGIRDWICNAYMAKIRSQRINEGVFKCVLSIPKKEAKEDILLKNSYGA